MRRVVQYFSLPAALALLALGGCSREAKVETHVQKAVEFQKQGEFDKARIEYMNALQNDPKYPAAIRGLGTLWLEDGYPLRAAAFLTEVVKENPDDLGARILLARIYFSFGDLAAARLEAVDVLGKDPGNFEAATLLLDTSVTQELLDDARAKIGSAIETKTADAAMLKSIIAMRGGNVSEAEQWIAEAEKLEPQNPDVLVSKAALQEAKGETSAARATLEKAAATAGPRSAASLRLAEHKAQHADSEGAIADMQRVLKEVPSFASAHILLARMHAASRNYEAARKQLQEVFVRDPSNLDGRLLESETLVFEGKAAEAVESLKALKEEYPRFPGVHFYLARAYLLTGNASLARAELKETLGLDPNFLDARVMLAELDLQEDRPEEAATAMRKLLEQAPNHFRAQTLLAASYREMGRLEEAAKILREQMAGAPENTEPLLLLAIVLNSLKQEDEAQELIDRALEVDPKNHLGLSLGVDMDVQRGRPEEALARIHEFREANPDSAVSYLLEGKVLMTQDRWPEARPLLEKAVTLDPDLTNGYEMLVTGFMANNELDSAIAQMQTFLERNPQNIPARLLLGIIREQQGRPEDAIEAYRQVIAADANSTVALNNLAWLASLEESTLDDAFDYASRARSLKPDDPFIADTLAWIHFKRGEYSDALRLLKESSERAPGQPEILYHLARANYMMGDREAAVAAMNEAMASDGQFPSRAEAGEMLARWQGEQTPGSLEELQKLADEHPNDPNVLMDLAAGLAEADQPEKAAELYAKVLEINPNMTAVSVALAKLQVNALANPAEAMKILLAARDRNPDSTALRAALGRVAYELENFQWAYSLLHESKAAQPDDAGIEADLARAAYAVGRLDEATRAMEAAIEDSQTPLREDQVFLELAKIDDPESAAGALAAAKSVEPNSPNRLAANYVIALSEEGGGAVDKARESFEAILANHPDFVPAARELVILLARDEEMRDKAYALGMQARKAFPTDPRLAGALGMVAYGRGDHRFASQLLREGVNGGIEDPETLFFYGMALSKTGSSENAAEYLNKALAAGLSGDLQNEAKDAVSKLQTSGENL